VARVAYVHGDTRGYHGHAVGRGLLAGDACLAGVAHHLRRAEVIVEVVAVGGGVGVAIGVGDDGAALAAGLDGVVAGERADAPCSRAVGVFADHVPPSIPSVPGEVGAGGTSRRYLLLDAPLAQRVVVVGDVGLSGEVAFVLL
jgi:hypothetical protein